jgi:hypothetical protein
MCWRFTRCDSLVPFSGLEIGDYMDYISILSVYMCVVCDSVSSSLMSSGFKTRVCE